ncbi:baseplate J/gp47 family protein [Paenibacillus graminis]|uniref:baseplate J/gp47 family protein n=1 Tax=Paenibacillus graminis TaxID=189425 RepID=UPI002DBC1AE7|nr:baseplate J/gp47 family protein [Paenibacillus graminis]MEC0169924.1 baseplate J/gp47 family protein [Paenibacillus graminis]
MAFERKSLENIVQDMVDWSRGVSSKITDYRVGSRARTLLEAVAKELEEFYDKVYRAARTLIAENIYTVMGFPKLPALFSTGSVIMSRSTPADADYLIAAGTLLRTRATALKAPISFRTSVDVILRTGETSISVPVICLMAGTDGNVDALTITEFVSKPAGIDAVSNTDSLTNGKEEETKDEQKNRFQKFIASLSRGTLPAIEYGATTVQLVSSDGLALERVVDAKAFEDTVNRKGEVDCYIWNGVGTASAQLIAATQRILSGYYEEGKPVYGYKPAGIQVNVLSAATKPVNIRVTLTMNTGLVLEDVRVYIEREVTDFFVTLKQGQTLIQTALETRIKLLDGIYDVKLHLSLDGGVHWSDENITAEQTEILLLRHPLVYRSGAD